MAVQLSQIFNLIHLRTHRIVAQNDTHCKAHTFSGIGASTAVELPLGPDIQGQEITLPECMYFLLTPLTVQQASDGGNTGIII